jgi:hypothetical protein
MKKIIQTDQGFMVWMGPHICESCYEIDKEKKTHYSLKMLNTLQLDDTISKSKYIYFNACTACHVGTFFSYRREGQKAGRFYSLIMIEQ